MSYDVRCAQLAQVFLEDDPRLSAHAKDLKASLAQRIQDCIEESLDGYTSNIAILEADPRTIGNRAGSICPTCNHRIRLINDSERFVTTECQCGMMQVDKTLAARVLA